MNKLTKLAAISMITLTMSGCAINVGAHGTNHGDLDSVFGGVEVDRNAKVGDISSVNGGVDLGAGAFAKDISTVNGGIDLANDVTIISAETVNGGIETGKNLSVENGLETVNGGIDISEGSHVGGSVTTVNGDIDLNNVLINKNIETVNGDIHLMNRSVVEGDIVIEKTNSWFSSIHKNIPVITIDESSSVLGTIHLYRKVKLKIAEGAKIGAVEEHFLRK